MLYLYLLTSMLLACNHCCAMENQPTRQRAATELTIKVFTKEERECSRKGRNRASSTTQATPRSHKKNFTELYEGLGLSPRSQEHTKQEASKAHIPEYMQNMPQVRTRTPRGSLATDNKKEEIKFKKQQNKSCCTIL